MREYRDTQRGAAMRLPTSGKASIPDFRIEFGSEQEEYRGALRIIKRGILGAAALVDRSSYGGSVVEVREGLLTPQHRSAYLWL